MWTIENRHRYDRDGLRCPSDLTAAEWALVKPLIPPAKRGGKRTVNMRKVVNGVMYAHTGDRDCLASRQCQELCRRAPALDCRAHIAWLNRCRHLAKDWEIRNHNALAFLHHASIRLTLRKLCNPL